MRQATITALTAAVIACTGCAMTTEPQKPSTATEETASSGTDVAIKPLEDASITDIEITLEAPAEPVDGFVIRWGTTPENLTGVQKVLSSELLPGPSEAGKSFYTYRLQDVPNAERLYVTVASFSGDTVSRPSAPIEVR